MIAKLWWIVHKDLLSEYRARRAWPAMLLLGVVVAFVFGIQMDLAPDHKQRVAGGLLWLAIFFAGMIALERSMTAERGDGCWEALLGYPIAPSAVYLAKVAVNVLWLTALQALLISLFVVFSDVPLLKYPGATLLVAALGNLGFAAVGTLVGGLVADMRQGGNFLALLLLPLVIPVVLAASEATSLAMGGDFGPAWWRWVQLLGGFAVVYTVTGSMLFKYAVEE